MKEKDLICIFLRLWDGVCWKYAFILPHFLYTFRYFFSFIFLCVVYFSFLHTYIYLLPAHFSLVFIIPFFHSFFFQCRFLFSLSNWFPLTFTFLLPSRFFLPINDLSFFPHIMMSIFFNDLFAFSLQFYDSWYHVVASSLLAFVSFYSFFFLHFLISAVSLLSFSLWKPYFVVLFPSLFHMFLIFRLLPGTSLCKFSFFTHLCICNFSSALQLLSRSFSFLTVISFTVFSSFSLLPSFFLHTFGHLLIVFSTFFFFYLSYLFSRVLWCLYFMFIF